MKTLVLLIIFLTGLVQAQFYKLENGQLSRLEFSTALEHCNKAVLWHEADSVTAYGFAKTGKAEVESIGFYAYSNAESNAEQAAKDLFKQIGQLPGEGELAYLQFGTQTCIVYTLFQRQGHGYPVLPPIGD